MKNLTGTPISRRLGKIIDEAQAAAKNPYNTDYRDVANLITALLDDVQTQGRRFYGRVKGGHRYSIILDWPRKEEAPTLTLRDLDADTETGYEDTTMDANADSFRILYLTATR